MNSTFFSHWEVFLHTLAFSTTFRPRVPQLLSPVKTYSLRPRLMLTPVLNVSQWVFSTDFNSSISKAKFSICLPKIIFLLLFSNSAVGTTIHPTAPALLYLFQTTEILKFHHLSISWLCSPLLVLPPLTFLNQGFITFHLGYGSNFLPGCSVSSIVPWWWLPIAATVL